MVALKQITDEPLSIKERIFLNSEKLKLAGIGLASLLEGESGKMYRQAMSKGENSIGNQNLLGRMATLSLGTMRLVQEESQRIFEDLVAEGEDVVERRTSGQAVDTADHKLGVQGAEKIQQRRTVAKTGSEGVLAKNAAAKKPTKQPAPASANNAEAPRLSATLQVRLKQAEKHVQALPELSAEQQALLQALKLQAEAGDVKGRRPGVKRPEAQQLFDQRKPLKGMKGEEAVLRYEALVEELRGVPQS